MALADLEPPNQLTRQPTQHSSLPAIAAGPTPQHWVYLTESGVAVARAGVWLGPVWEGQKTGFVGAVAAKSPELIQQVLALAAAKLSELGAELALGPVAGSTWFSYRLMTQTEVTQLGASGTLGQRPPFLLEPWNTEAEVESWKQAGFSEYLTYHSALATQQSHPTDLRMADLERKFKEVVIRSPTLEEPSLSHDLAALHTLSLDAFAGNPLYSPLPLSAFESLYRPLLGRVPLDWVWLAQHNGQLVGFLFAYPDSSGTLVLKTLAIRSGRAYAGLGRHLSNLFHQKAFAIGVKEVIHALMWDGNESAVLSAKRGDVIRRYAVFGKALEKAIEQ